jgi:hypothetical protein
LPENDPIHRVHSNVVAVHGGAYDLTLDFGYRPDDREDPIFESRVSMSWEHAISMVAILERMIDQYEAQIPSLAAVRTKLAETIEIQPTVVNAPEDEDQ